MGAFMGDILDYLQVHIPFGMLHGDFLDRIVTEKISPEIGFNCAVLDSTKRERFQEVAERLENAGVTVTFHAPFMDLRPGAIDPRIREVSRDRLLQVFELVPLFRPLRVVCHPSFDPRYYLSTEGQWLENSLALWQSFAALAEELKTMIVLENVYEETPRQISARLRGLNSRTGGFCFDTGHYNVFSGCPLEVWLKELGGYLAEVHLHDNDGRRDLHLPVGEGTFPFEPLFCFLRECIQKPILTLEAHSESHFLKTVETLQKNRLFGLA